MAYDPVEDQNRKDLTTLDGYRRFWFETLYAFRDVAIDNHLDGGNLDALTYHVAGVVSTQTLMNNYDLPVVLSIPGQHSPAAGTLGSEQGTLDVTVAVFGANLHRETALDDAADLAGQVVDNVEADPELVNSDGPTAPGTAKVVNTRLTSFEPDFEENPPPGRAQLKWCAATFTLELKRRYGHP